MLSKLPIGTAVLSFLAAACTLAQTPPLPSGQYVTPSAAPGAIFQNLNPGLAAFPNYLAGQAVRSLVSPDGRTLLVMTSGYNGLSNSNGSLDTTSSSEYLFVYDISAHTPVRRQVVQIPTTYVGLAFSPDGKKFYVGGGGADDVSTYALVQGQWALLGNSIALGHKAGVGNGNSPSTAGLAVTADDAKILVANIYNDSVSLISTASNSVTGELDLRPGVIDAAQNGVPGGETPFDIVIQGTTAYVSTLRDREIDVLDIAGTAPVLKTRIPVRGTPNRMRMNRAGTLLYVAADNDDSVQVIGTAANKVIERIEVGVPAVLSATHERYRGAAPNALALSPDENTLYVSEGGLNAIGVVNVAPGQIHTLYGLLPTAWYPQDVAAAGGWLYAVNSKSDSGPNLRYCPGETQFFPGLPWVANCGVNDSVFQLEHAGFLAEPVPNLLETAKLTRQVAANDGILRKPEPADSETMEELHRRIKHVIYIIKENRTYDQVLGDLGRGNGDPSLVEFGQAITPNLHRIATDFVDLDNFEATAEVSGNGWQWSTAGRESDFNVKTIPLDYSPRPHTSGVADDEGINRGVWRGSGTVAGRQAENPSYPNDPNLLPSTNDEDALDGPLDDDTPGKTLNGYIWNSALRAGLTVRNYGFYDDQNLYGPSPTSYGKRGTEIPRDPNPYADRVAMGFSSNPILAPLTDVYFRGIDTAYPDYPRVQEWKREFDQFEAAGNLPNLSLLRLGNDHTGNFSAAILGVNTPETELADNDYAVGLVAQTVAHSADADSTLIFVLEDDAQDGPDHVDSHRTTAYVIGPYVKQGAVVSTRYTTVNMLRTIEDVLGIDHLNVNDAFQPPMTQVFDLSRKKWDFQAAPSSYLCATQLPVSCQSAASQPTHTSLWWAKKTKGLDLVDVDAANPAVYNRVLWQGLVGNRPYPTVRNGKDLTPRTSAR